MVARQIKLYHWKLQFFLISLNFRVKYSKIRKRKMMAQVINVVPSRL